jgi:hypothetical protein
MENVFSVRYGILFGCTPNFNRLSPVSIFPPLLHTDIHVALTGRGKGLNLKTFQKAVLVRKSGNFG